MTDENTKDVFEKKTERLDIRLSHSKKQDFTQACENQGDTPSDAVRRFVATYIRRANRDEVASVIRFSPWKRGAVWAASLLIAGLIGTTIWGISSSRHSATLTAQLFDIYDENKNGLIDLGEISPDDFHLHRVLNIDGQDGISSEEFQAEGLMTWSFVESDNFKIIKNEVDLLKQTSTTQIVTSSGKPINLNQKMFVKRNGEFVELNNEADWEDFLASDIESIKEHGQITNSYGSTTDDFRAHPDIAAEAREYGQRHKTKYVQFDLRKPNNYELTVFEQEGFGKIQKSITPFQRSVTWVEGRKTPEIVMGMGRENAVLTQQASAAP